jgi:hypothetical protein
MEAQTQGRNAETEAKRQNEAHSTAEKQKGSETQKNNDNREQNMRQLRATKRNRQAASRAK